MRTILVMLTVGCVVGSMWSRNLSARELHQGGMMVSLGGGLSQNSFSIGGTFGYFVLKPLMVGTSYYFTQENQSMLVGDQDGWRKEDYTARSHDVTVFGRYYLLTRGAFFPFLYAGGGYENYGWSGSAVVEQSFHLWSALAGGGIMAVLAERFGIEVTAGVRRYLVVPGELEQSDFDKTAFEWRIGFGLYF